MKKEERKEKKKSQRTKIAHNAKMIIPFYYEHNVCLGNDPSPTTRISYSSSVSVSVSVSLSLSSSSSVPDS